MMRKALESKTIYPVLFAISLAHMINDTLQSVIPAVYPILRESMNLTYTQLGMITFILFFSSSVLQPAVGLYSDARPSPYLLPIAMTVLLLGMLCLAFAPGYGTILGIAAMVGFASAMFHPEGARIAYLTAGSRRGLAQSIFQVGGNAGSAMAPLITVLIFYPFGQFGAVWFTLLATAGIAVQLGVARWYKNQLALTPRVNSKKAVVQGDRKQRKKVVSAFVIIILMAFASAWYGSSLSTYFVYYLIEKFQMSIPHAQLYIFMYMGAGIVGTFCGGPLSDRIGRKNVILFSLLGAAPFAVLLPHVNAIAAYPLLLLLGLINQSSFSVTVVYVQELVPGNVGMVSGLITGLAFGMGAIGAVALGGLIDLTSLSLVILASSLLPLLGIVGFLLPADRK